MNKLHTLSLIIPTFNRKDLLLETLGSAIVQNPPFDEIIVIDDGSSDDTETAVTTIYSTVRYMKVANGGVQRARNLGAEMATTDWLTLCDSDDILDRNYTSRIHAYLSKNSAIDIAYVNFNNFSEDHYDIDKLSQSPFDYLDGATIIDDVATDIPDLLIRNFRYQPLFPSGALIKRSFYFELGGFDCTLNGVGSEDWDFTLRAIINGRVAIFKPPLVYIRRHQTNDSADSLRMTAGEIKILERFRQKVSLKPKVLTACSNAIDSKRAAAGNLSYDRQQFEDVVGYVSWRSLREGGKSVV